MVDVELLDRECQACDVTAETADYDYVETYGTDQFMSDNVTTGAVEEHPFDVTAEVREDWQVTVEQRDRYTVETRITDIDVSETDEVEGRNLRADIDVESVHQQLLESGVIGMDVDTQKDKVIDTETMEEPCPADDCDSDRAYYEMMPKPGGSYEVRLFTCVECGHKWWSPDRASREPRRLHMHRPPHQTLNSRGYSVSSGATHRLQTNFHNVLEAINNLCHKSLCWDVHSPIIGAVIVGTLALLKPPPADRINAVVNNIERVFIVVYWRQQYTHPDRQ